MSKIKIFGLGGLNEVGKNMYCFEHENEILIIDAGVLFPGDSLPGIDYVIPDFEYLIKNKNRVKGIFLTHGHYENMGGVADLLADCPNIKVFATKFTKYILLVA